MANYNINSSLSLVLLLILQCQALTYFMDVSCTVPLVGVMTEVQNMAKRGGAQLADSGNEVMGAAFNQIFKVEKSNAATVKIVSDAFSVIGGVTPTITLEISDVRIYCDNDDAGQISDGKRWQPIPDLPGAGKKSKNSKKPFAQQQWWDHINRIYRKPGSMGVQDLNHQTLGQTYKIRDEQAAGQNPSRETITIANAGFNMKPRLLSAIGPKADMTKGEIEFLEDFISMTLFHEFCHLTKVIGAPGAPDPVGWEAIKDIDAATALISPDCYAFLGLSAILNDRNIRLATAAADAEAGSLEFITPPAATSGGSKVRRVNSYRPRLRERAIFTSKFEKRGLSQAAVQVGTPVVVGVRSKLFAA